MSTTPPEQPPTQQPSTEQPSGSGTRPTGVTFAGNLDLARLPFPGNAELLVYLLVWLVIALIWLFSDEVGAGTFATLTVALTFGYLISRGIAKAGRVLEH
ncbi:MAG: hypothetical protein M3321_08330 [Actinomycetota bacterium]|nr:hypothetical protein [Actinomycetota bacterium]